MNMNNHNAREKISQVGSLKVKLFPNFNPFTKDKGGGGVLKLGNFSQIIPPD